MSFTARGVNSFSTHVFSRISKNSMRLIKQLELKTSSKLWELERQLREKKK